MFADGPDQWYRREQARGASLRVSIPLCVPLDQILICYCCRYNNETAKYEQVGDVSKRAYCISNCMVPSSELPSKSKSSRAGKVVTLSTYKKSTGNRKYMSGHYSANKKMRTAFSSIYQKTQKELMVRLVWFGLNVLSCDAQVFVKHCIEHKVRGKRVSS